MLSNGWQRLLDSSPRSGCRTVFQQLPNLTRNTGQRSWLSSKPESNRSSQIGCRSAISRQASFDLGLSQDLPVLQALTCQIGAYPLQRTLVQVAIFPSSSRTSNLLLTSRSAEIGKNSFPHELHTKFYTLLIPFIFMQGWSCFCVRQNVLEYRVNGTMCKYHTYLPFFIHRLLFPRGCREVTQIPIISI